MNVVNSMSWKPVIPQIDPVGSLTVCESLDAEAALKCQWTIKVTQGESFDDLFRLSAPSELCSTESIDGVLGKHFSGLICQTHNLSLGVGFTENLPGTI